MKKSLIVVILSVFAFQLSAKEKATPSIIYDFYVACSNGDVKTVKNFCKNYSDGVNVELSSNSEDNYNYHAFAEYLILSGIQLPFENKNEETEWIKKYKRYPINIAARYGHNDIVKVLIENHADLELREETDYTPLMIAAGNGYIDIVKELITNGSDINVKTYDDISALLLAVYKSQIEIVKFLIANGADVNIIVQNGVNKGISLLQIGIIQQNKEIIQLLLNEKADLNNLEIDPSRICIDIFAALVIGNPEIACMILKNENYKDAFFNPIEKQTLKINLTSAEGRPRTMLMYAIEQKFIDFVYLLVENGIDVNETNKDGETALMIAAINNEIEIVNLLMKYGADINAKDNDGISVLQYAAIGGTKDSDTRVFRILYLAGAKAE